jgi:hypothetical protein
MPCAAHPCCELRAALDSPEWTAQNTLPWWTSWLRRPMPFGLQHHDFSSAMAALAHRRDPAHDVHAAAVSRLLFSSSPPVDHGCGQLVPGGDSLDEPVDLSAGVRALQEPLPLCRDVLRIRAGWHALVFRSHHPCGFRPIGRRRYCDACEGFRPTSSPPSGAASLPLCEL